MADIILTTHFREYTKREATATMRYIKRDLKDRGRKVPECDMEFHKVMLMTLRWPHISGHYKDPVAR